MFLICWIELRSFAVFLSALFKLPGLTILGDQSTDGCFYVGDYFVQLYRKYGLHANDRVAIMSAVDELVCIQLVMAATNKQVSN